MMHHGYIFVVLTLMVCLMNRECDSEKTFEVNRAFPTAKQHHCSFKKDDLNDVEALLKSTTGNTTLSQTDVTRIIHRTSVNTTAASGDSCNLSFWKILNAVQEIVAIQLETADEAQMRNLETRYVQLLKEYDTLKRMTSAEVKEALDKQQSMVQELLQKNRALEKSILKANMELDEANVKIIAKNIKSRDYDEAKHYLLSLENNINLVGNVIKEAYGESREMLDNVVHFIDLLPEFELIFKALNVLYSEMEKNNHSAEKELLYIYFEMKWLISHSNFFRHSKEQIYEFLTFKNKISDKIENMLTSLANDVRKGNFERSTKAHEMLRKYELADFYLFEFIPAFDLAKTANEDLYELLVYISGFKSVEDKCFALGEIYAALNQGKDVDKLLVWVHATNVTNSNQEGVDYSPTHDKICRNIQNSQPGSKAEVWDAFTDKINNQETNDIRQMYSSSANMKWITSEILKKITKDQLKKGTLEKLRELLKNDGFPTMEDKIVVFESIHKTLKRYDLLGSHVYLKILQFMRGRVSENNLSQRFQQIFTKAAYNIPTAFEKLLTRKTDDCTLKNYDVDEYMYCSAAYRGFEIFLLLKSNKEVLAYNGHWKLELTADGLVRIKNLGHHRYLDHKPEISKITSIDRDDAPGTYFRIHAVGDNFIKIQAKSNDDYVITEDVHSHCESRSRCVRIGEGDNNYSRMWKMSCS